MPAQPTAAPRTLKVGIEAFITGQGARNGISMDRWYRMGIDDVNAKGGVKVAGQTYRFEAVTVDNKETAEDGRLAGTRLALAEKVKIVLGSVNTRLAGSQPVYEQNNMLVLTLGAFDSQLGPSHPTTLVVGTVPQRVRFPAVYDWLVKNHPEAKRLVFTAQDDANGRENAQVAEDLTKTRGLALLAKEIFPTDTKDFNAVATRILNHKPDAIDMGPLLSRVAYLAGLTRALYEQDYRKPVIGGTADMGALRQNSPATDGIVFTQLSDWNAPVVPAKERDIIERYIKTYGERELELATEPVYIAPSILAQAMEKAGTVDDITKITQTLREGEWDTIWGKARFFGAKTYGAPSVLEMPLYISRVQPGGKSTTIDVMRPTAP